MEQTPNPFEFRDALFPDEDARKLHQLRLLEWMVTAERRRSIGDVQHGTQVLAPDEVPARWQLAKGVEPRTWQRDCIDKWFKKGRGTAKIVTGAGKTLLALLIAESLQN